MRRRPRDIGTDTERAVVRWLRENGFPNAERRALRGHQDAGDITGTPGVAWEVKGGAAAKAASDLQVDQWLADTEQERVNAAADIGILVLQRAGIGPVNAGRWWAILPHWQMQQLTGAPIGAIWPVRMHLHAAAALLVMAGYGSLP